jgi:preprotein translocase subunit SecA
LPIPPAVDPAATRGVTDHRGDSAASPELEDTPGLRVLQFELQELARQDRRILHLVGRRGQAGLARQYLAIDDDLFQYHLPAWCRGLHTRTAKNLPKLLPRITFWLVRYAQYRAQNLARRQRLTQPRREALLNQQLAFAGDRDMDVGTQHFGKL